MPMRILMNALLNSIQHVSKALTEHRNVLCKLPELAVAKNISHLLGSIHLVSDSYRVLPVERVKVAEMPSFQHLTTSIKNVSLMTTNNHSPIKFRDSQGEALVNFLNKEESENFHSDFLSGFLDVKKSGPLAGAFFRELVYFATGKEIPTPSNVVSRRELSLSELLPGVRDEIAARRIDIIAHTEDYLLVIENKVNTYESTSQTSDYHEVAEQFNSNLIQPKKLVEILLSPRGDTPECNAYVPMTYHHLFLILLNLQNTVECGQSRFLDLYLESLYENYFKSNQLYKEFISEFWRTK